MKVGECDSCGQPAIKTGMDIEVKHLPSCKDWKMRRRYNEVPQSWVDEGKCGKYGWAHGDPRNEDSYWEKSL